MKILDFIVCDDIRHEISNKHTLVGTYNDQLVMQTKADIELKLPIAVKLAFYVKIDLQNETRIKKIEFKFAGPSIDDAEGHIDLQILDASRPMILALTNLVFNIKGPGKLDAEFVFKDNDGVVLNKIRPDFNFSVQFKKVT